MSHVCVSKSTYALETAVRHVWGRLRVSSRSSLPGWLLVTGVRWLPFSSPRAVLASAGARGATRTPTRLLSRTRWSSVSIRYRSRPGPCVFLTHVDPPAFDPLCCVNSALLIQYSKYRHIQSTSVSPFLTETCTPLSSSKFQRIFLETSKEVLDLLVLELIRVTSGGSGC